MLLFSPPPPLSRCSIRFVSLRDAEELNRVEDHAGNAFKYGGPWPKEHRRRIDQVARWEDLIGPGKRARINNSGLLRRLRHSLSLFLSLSLSLYELSVLTRSRARVLIYNECAYRVGGGRCTFRRIVASALLLLLLLSSLSLSLFLSVSCSLARCRFSSFSAGRNTRTSRILRKLR